MTAPPRPDLSLRLKLLVVGVLYVAEGIPFGLIITSMNAYLAGQGVPPEQIGVLSLLGLAWSLKFFWSPLVDRFGSRAAWIVGAQAVMSLCLLGLALQADGPVNLVFWVLLGILVVASATQDLAIDAYTIDFLETSELGLANGVRSGAYRIGSLAAGSGLLILADQVGWRPALVGLTITLAALALTIWVFRPFHLPRPVEGAAARQDGPLATFRSALTGLWSHTAIAVIIVFTLTYKAGDALMGTMVIPFWKSQGFSNTEIGVVSGILGSVATSLGALLGGWFTSRAGIGTSLWVLGLFQAVSNLGYWAAALPGMGRKVLFHLSLPFLDASWPVYPIYLASQGESLSSGLGYAPFMAFLMSLCDKRFSATQYAFFVFLSVLSGRIMGFLGGFGVKYLGYAPFFFVTFLAALPAFALLPWILPVARQVEGRE
ncbi:MAG: AmpG family muropeptide MFS transporter [Deltaproteobacteria bacterium]|nr:AmpG family muropeptide MFS transporter [Deltaproteobacteria bacterium]